MRLLRLWAIVLPVLLLAAALPVRAQEEGGKRVALVIGNAAYRAVPGLSNPANDARLLAKTLRAKGFTLVGGDARIDLDAARFDAAVTAFGQALRGADVALFFYAGHGMQVRGANWLVPVDARPHRAGDLDTQMVNAARVLAAMKAAGTKLNLVVLDACRDNPFPDLQAPGGESALAPAPIAGPARGRGLGARGGGLAQMQAPEGTVIAFATQPGDVAQDGAGGDSPFTVALVQALQQPGLDVLALFNSVGVAVKRATGGQQQPWVSSSPIEGEYFLGEQSHLTAAEPPGLPPQTASSTRPMQPAGPTPLATRVQAQAAPLGIPVPAGLRVVPAAPDVPRLLARLLGVWGPARWSARRATNDFMVAITQIDASGRARLSVMNSAGCVDADCTVRAPFVGHATATLQDGRLTFQSKRTGRAIAFWLAGDDRLAGSMEMASRTAISSLKRID